MTKEQFKKQIPVIKLVLGDGVALQLFSSPGFLGLMGELATKLGVSFERHCVRDIVINETDNQKQLLKEKLYDKFCYLKTNACTRHGVNYFAINVQFMNDNNKLTIRTLAVRDSHALHREHFVKCLVKEVLKEFTIGRGGHFRKSVRKSANYGLLFLFADLR